MHGVRQRLLDKLARLAQVRAAKSCDFVADAERGSSGMGFTLNRRDGVRRTAFDLLARADVGLAELANRDLARASAGS